MSDRSRTIVLATHNPDKARELRALFGSLEGVDVVTAGDLKGDVPEPVEDGSSLVENALIKARALAAFSGTLSVADDTGLEVDALGGAPGIHAARYAGENATYADNCAKLLRELDGVPTHDRSARFRTVMALVDPATGIELTVDGVLEGRILDAMRGDGGFGYDPLFALADRDATLAEIPPAEKNQISHRARASVEMLEVLREHLGSDG